MSKLRANELAGSCRERFPLGVKVRRIMDIKPNAPPVGITGRVVGYVDNYVLVAWQNWQCPYKAVYNIDPFSRLWVTGYNVWACLQDSLALAD